jgi:hypothetical protein
MSSDLWLTLPELLARHDGQVVLLVVRDLAVPHDKDDLQLFRTQRSQRLVMRVAPRPLLVVVRSGPVAGEQREEGHLVDHVPQRLVAGEAEVDTALLAAPFRHGHGAGLRLQMSKRLPPSGGVPQAGPEGRRGDPVLTDREGPRPLRRRHARENIVDRFPILGDGSDDGSQLRHQALHQPRLGAHHVGGHGQLGLLEDMPEVTDAGLAQPAAARDRLREQLMRDDVDHTWPPTFLNR